MKCAYRLKVYNLEHILVFYLFLSTSSPRQSRPPSSSCTVFILSVAQGFPVCRGFKRQQIAPFEIECSHPHLSPLSSAILICPPPSVMLILCGLLSCKQDYEAPQSSDVLRNTALLWEGGGAKKGRGQRVCVCAGWSSHMCVCVCDDKILPSLAGLAHTHTLLMHN